jgi:peptidoglycan pentaglycine glycine transferase (the first glycine)
VTAPAPDAEARPVPGRPEPAAWDAAVEANPLGSYLQLTAWARVKAVNGWRSRRMLDGVDEEAVGAQVLLRRPGPLPWSFAYAPRGPVLGTWDEASIERFTALARQRLKGAGRPSHLRIDPEIERGAGRDEGGRVTSALGAAGWQPATAIQPVSTRAIDLTADEDALWGELRKKWRQYVNKARTGGVRIVDAGPERLDEFYAIYRETADRAGFLIRAKSAYNDVWQAYAPAGRARLLFAELPDGTPVATLFLVRAGTRVVEPYGGMTPAGADSRANYLLKWEAIRSSRERGFVVYDMWGLSHAGIEQFKAGFGGRELTYVGGRALVIDRLGSMALGVARRISVARARRRHGLAGGGGAT